MSDAVLETPTALAQPVKARRRPLPLVIALVGVLVAALWGWRRYQFNLSHVSTDNAQVDGHITPIAPKVQAFVSTVRVEENQAVRAGDTLVVLDDRDLRVRLAQAEAELANARATGGSRRVPGQVQAQLAASEAQAQSTTATVASAEAADRKARADLARLRGLADRGIVAAQQLDAAQAAADAAAANLEAARRQAGAAAEQVHAFAAGVGAAAARIASAEAAVASARLQLSYTVLTAPVAGVIGRRAVEPGALVQVGQTLMSVIPDSGVWVTANLKETEVEAVRVGDSVSFTVDAYPGQTFTGQVSSLSPATGARFALLPPDNATGNFTKVVQRVPVRIEVGAPDPAHPLRPGMSVVATIRTR
ncbi:MAG: HlyD family secretion protein [Gemmatimonadales bacterium]